jgi:hypothetical protein
VQRKLTFDLNRRQRLPYRRLKPGSHHSSFLGLCRSQGPNAVPAAKAPINPAPSLSAEDDASNTAPAIMDWVFWEPPDYIKPKDPDRLKLLRHFVISILSGRQFPTIATPVSTTRISASSTLTPSPNSTM